MRKTRRKIFIGSSRKYLVLADALKKQFDLDDRVEAITWSEHFRDKGGGKYTYDTLLQAVKDFEFAVFFLTRDFALEDSSSKSISTPNIWFEAGLWMSRYGKENVLLIQEKQEHYKEKILFLTDLTGLQPQYWSADQEIRRKILNRKKIPAYRDLGIDIKEKLNEQFTPLKEQIKRLLFDDIDRLGPASDNIKNRKECYDVAENIISSAEKFVYSIISYEDELEDDEHPQGLWPFIKDRINEFKDDPKYVKSDLSKKFKRWMNLGNKKIAEQAHEILEEYSGDIEIRDTYCNFIEAVITEDKVLLVLPKKYSIQVGFGVLIKSIPIAKEFRYWFEHYVSEPNGILIDSSEKLKKYQSFNWQMINKRNGVLNDRCNSCFIKYNEQEDSWREALQNAGLKDKK